MSKDAKYVVRLTDEERCELQAIVDEGRGSKSVRQRARVLLKTDASETGPRQYGHSDHVCDECGEPEEAGVVGWFLLVSGGDPAAAFEAAEEPLNAVAALVDRLVVATLSLAGWVRFDADLRPQTTATLTNRIGVVGRVGDDRADLAATKCVQKHFRDWSIATLAGCQTKVDQSPGGSRHRMHLRRQSPA